MKENFLRKYLALQIAGAILPLYLRSRISQGVDAQWPTDPLTIKAFLAASSRKYTETFKLVRFFDFATSKSGGRRSQALPGFSFEGRQDNGRFEVCRFFPSHPVRIARESRCSRWSRHADIRIGGLAIVFPCVFSALKKGGPNHDLLSV